MGRLAVVVDDVEVEVVVVVEVEDVVDSIAHAPLSLASMTPVSSVSAASIHRLKPLHAACVYLPGASTHLALVLIAQVTLPAAVFLMQGTTPLLAGTPQVDVK